MMTHVNLRLTIILILHTHIHVPFSEPGIPITFVHAKMLQNPAFIQGVCNQK